jgi:hypothetical protein
MISLDCLKSIAKQKSKKESLSITQAQNEIAKKHGYENWQKLTYGFSIKIAHLCKVKGWYRVEVRKYDKITLEGLQKMVGDYIELVPPNVKKWIFTDSIIPLNRPATKTEAKKLKFIKGIVENISMYVDERGEEEAISIAPIVGPIVFLGHDKNNPENERGLSDQSIEQLKTFIELLWGSDDEDEEIDDEEWGWFDKTKS